MRPKLLQSFIVVLLFWFFGTTLWWSFQQPKVNLEALAALKAMMPFLPFEVPKEASILTSIIVQSKVLLYWSLPMLLGTAISAGIGYGLRWLKAHKKSDERIARETGSGDYRGVTLTVGELPTPKALPKDDIELCADDDESLARMTERELKLLSEILGTMSAHPDAFAGEGISCSLLEHSLNIASRALASPRYPGLSALVAAGHELGKITAFRKTPAGEWEQFKNPDKEASKIIGLMESWYALPSQDRNAVQMAIKFYSSPKTLPEIESDSVAYRMARELLTVADDKQAEVVQEERQKTLEKSAGALPDVIFDSFMKALPQLSFQNRGLPKGVAAVAWKVGSRVYLLEIKLRETVMVKIPADVRGALVPNPKERVKVQPFTLELLKALDAQGWLVKKLNDVKLETKDALWNIKAGKLDFKGVIIIDVPAEYMAQLPADDSMYEVSVTGSLFSNGAGMAMSKNDLLGCVLKPASQDATQQNSTPNV
jgi:hypothetical protein